jgi:hypothetical protein
LSTYHCNYSLTFQGFSSSGAFAFSSPFNLGPSLNFSYPPYFTVSCSLS